MKVSSILVAAACVIAASCGGPPGPDRPTALQRVAERPAAEPSVADRPPGVGEDSWVRLSDTAGIVLTDVRATRATIRLKGIDVETVVPPLLQQGTGVLMVKLGDAWIRVDLALPAPRVQPLL
jgi:hypothetical protein